MHVDCSVLIWYMFFFWFSLLVHMWFQNYPIYCMIFAHNIPDSSSWDINISFRPLHVWLVLLLFQAIHGNLPPTFFCYTLCRKISIGPTSPYSEAFSFWFLCSLLVALPEKKEQRRFPRTHQCLIISAPTRLPPFNILKKTFIPQILTVYLFMLTSLFFRDKMAYTNKQILKSRVHITVSCHISLQKQEN